MADHPGWYPPGQVLYPPELPTYLNNVYALKPIVGVSSDAEVIGIHAVLQAANRASGIPGMHDPSLIMKLSDHLFGAHMARYRSKYSLVTFPSDATYTPPALPTHMAVNLESVSGTPSDDEIMKVQDALHTYQEFRRIPSMFDAHVNMELSQHLFNLQMARHMRLAGETSSIPPPQVATNPESPRHTSTAEETTATTNNAGTGANVTGIHQTPQLAPVTDVRDLMERSNQLAERFNQLLERSNELVERYTEPANEPASSTISERFNQVLERLTGLVERANQPVERSNSLTERFNQLFERFNQLVDQSNQSTQKSNEFAKRSTELADGANQLAEKFNRLFERSNQLSEQSIKPVEGMRDLLKNINKVLVGIQHAIVRNNKGNTINAIDCLVNEKGETRGEAWLEFPERNLNTMRRSSEFRTTHPQYAISVTINGAAQSCFIPDAWLGDFLQFYGIGQGLCVDESISLIEGKKVEAQIRLRNYLSSRLG